MRDAGCLRDLRPGRHLRGDHPADRRDAGRASTRASRCAASSATSSTTSSASPTPANRRLIAFLGGTIGNLYPYQRRSFMCRIAALMFPGDHFLLGTDLIKDPARLEAAYDDAEGVTAEFNKNVLEVLNRELGADFDLDAFEHVARYDRDEERMDIRLRSLADQRVRLEGIDLDGRVRRRRGAADRDLDQVHPRAPRRGLRPRRAGALRLVHRRGRRLRAQPRAPARAPETEPMLRSSSAPAPRSARRACRAS